MEKYSRRMVNRAARTPSSREQRSSFFRVFLRGSSTTCYVTDFCRVGRVVYPSWGTTPRNFQFSGAGVVAQSCAATRLTTRKDAAIIDICMVVFGSIALFLLHARGS